MIGRKAVVVSRQPNASPLDPSAVGQESGSKATQGEESFHPTQGNRTLPDWSRVQRVNPHSVEGRHQGTGHTGRSVYSTKPVRPIPHTRMLSFE